MEEYIPAPLSEAPDPQIVKLVSAARQRRLVLYLGAGISLSPPACGPKGMAVADMLRPFVARMLEVAGDDLVGLTLEELAQRVSDQMSDRLDEVREEAAKTFDFRGITPNFGHEVAALLLREGSVEVISVNWDCGVEEAGVALGFSVRGVANLTESLEISHAAPVYKVHGCATRPRTLAITQDDVDEPQTWAVGRTQAALVGGSVAFIGLGTVGLYVREPFPALVSAWAAQASTVAIVDPDLADAWREVLGDEQAKQLHLAHTADRFMDDLLRALVRDALDSSDLLARQIREHDEWAQALVAGVDSLRRALDDATAVGVLRWWRDGAAADASGTAGSPFITELAGQRSLLTVAQLAANDGTEIVVSGPPGRQSVGTADQYFEIFSRPRQHVSRVQVLARSRIRKRWDAGIYAEAKPVTVVVADATGEFPSDRAPIDIAEEAPSEGDIATAVESLPVRFVAAEDVVRGRLAA